MSGESPAQNMLNQGGGGVHGSSGNIGATTTTTSALGSMGSMMPNSVGSPAGAEPQLNATQLPSSQGSVPQNTGQVSQNLGTSVPNYLGHTQILGQQKPGMGRQQQQQQMLACPPSALQAQQNLGSNPSQSPTGSLSSMHRSSSANRLGQLPYTSSAVRPPPLYGHGQLPFNPHLQHQQQPQMTRSGMIGQGPSPGHLSILSGQSGQLSGFSPQFLPQQQVRQKPGQIQGSQFQQPVSSGQPLQSMQAIGLMGSIGLGSQNRMSGSLYAQQRIGQGTLRSPPSQSPQQSLSSPQVQSSVKQVTSFYPGLRSARVSSSPRALKTRLRNPLRSPLRKNPKLLLPLLLRRRERSLPLARWRNARRILLMPKSTIGGTGFASNIQRLELCSFLVSSNASASNVADSMC